MTTSRCSGRTTRMLSQALKAATKERVLIVGSSYAQASNLRELFAQMAREQGLATSNERAHAVHVNGNLVQFTWPDQKGVPHPRTHVYQD